MVDQRETGEIINGISTDIRAIVSAEIELAKSELMPSVKQGGLGAGLFGGAGYFALNGLSLLFIAASLALSMLINNLWPIGFVIMGVLLLIIAGVLGLLGKGRIDQAKPTTPLAAATEAKVTVDTVKSALAVANARVRNPELAARSRQRELP